jgi:hypothetical protein
MCKREVGELINKTLVFPLFGLTLTTDLRLRHRPSGGHIIPPSLLEFAIPTWSLLRDVNLMGGRCFCICVFSHLVTNGSCVLYTCMCKIVLFGVG